MPRFPALPALLVTISLLTGCLQVGTLRFAQDRPEVIQQLLEQDEYARARQVVEAHPDAATPELLVEITTRESAYENRAFEQARAREAEHDLIGAVEGLSGALKKIPDSTLLHEYHEQLDRERTSQLLENEHRQHVARARYLLDELALYEQQANLQSPTLGQQWKNSNNRKEALGLSGTLLEHGQQALADDKLESARESLDLSLALHETDAANRAIGELHEKEKLRQSVVKKEQATKRKEQKISRKQKARSLVGKARTELEGGDLDAARTTWGHVPASERNSKAATQLQADLQQAIDTKVESLILKGDSLYRADKVDRAISTWSEANSLDPGNPEVTGRLERANKVLARLEELKNLQKK